MQALLQKVFGKWLVVHCPTAKRLLAEALIGGDAGGAGEGGGSGPPTADRTKVRVTVETFAGLPVGVFECERSLTIGELRRRIEQHNPEFPETAQQLFSPGSPAALSQAVELGSLTAAHSDENAAIALVVGLQLYRWSREKSNPHLVFLDDDRAIKRPGSRSSYPCGRADRLLHRHGDSFSVCIRELPPVNNALTIGILSHGADFRNASSSGVGGTKETMGIHIDNVKTRITGNKPIDRCVKVANRFVGPEAEMFKPGDRLTFTIREEPSHWTLAITLNDQAFHTEPIPNYFQLPFQPLCTLPDDCVLALL